MSAAAAIDDATTVVVKVGTRVLTDPQGRLDLRRIDCLSLGLNAIADSGRRTILVSSGAVAAGVAKLDLPARPTGLASLQAVAAVGQTDLITAYDRSLSRGGRHAAQVLLTAEDLRSRSGYLNVRNTLAKIHEYGSIPVVNENDSVAVAELMTTFGDNDSLAAAVAGLFTDVLLVILSDVAGLYDGPPHQDSSVVVPRVDQVDESIRRLAVPHDSRTSKGGMIGKLDAAAKGNWQGNHVIVAPGTDDHALEKILRGEPIGTWFVRDSQPVRGRRRWIGGEARVVGCITVDAGAVDAMTSGGASLLSVGITSVDGNFERGDVVKIIGPDGRDVGRGLINYPAAEARKLCGHRASEIMTILGYQADEAVVHRDNFVLSDL